MDGNRKPKPKSKEKPKSDSDAKLQPKEEGEAPSGSRSGRQNWGNSAGASAVAPKQKLSKMDALKKFMQKRKADSNFKKAGPGHRLADSTPSGSSGSAGSSGAAKGAPPVGVKKPPSASGQTSEEKRAAAAAALARREKNMPATNETLLASRQLAYIREQAKKEIEAENKLKELGVKDEGKGGQSHSGGGLEESYTMRGGNVDPSHYAVSGVFYTCPLIGPEVATKAEIQDSIKHFLRAQPQEEQGVTSCLLIHSCNANRGREKIQTCVATLCKYIDNIIQNPSEPKFQKIRCNNKAFNEKVSCMEGATQFLEAAEFKKVKQVNEESKEEEEVFEFSPSGGEAAFVAKLTELRDTLQSTSPIKPELDRNLQVLMPVEVTQRRELPPEFYELSGDELKREQLRRTEQVEKELTLRTKAQRQQDEQREQRLYRYACLRVKFPDGFTLQGTFHSYEKVGDLYIFVQENLGVENAEFSLRKAGGEVLSDLEQTLAEAKLPPASIVNFKIESGLAPGTDINFLKPEILALVRDPNL